MRHTLALLAVLVLALAACTGDGDATVGDAPAALSLDTGTGPLPEDVIVANELSENATAEQRAVDGVGADEMILDIGPKARESVAGILKSAGTIVWNGPVGVFEIDAFGGGTEALSQAIAESEAFSIAGGGDTLAAIEKYGVGNDVSYISTGGGAFLEFLEGKTLPAIAALANRAQ